MSEDAREATAALIADLLTRGSTIITQPTSNGGYRVAISDTTSNLMGLGWGDTLDIAMADAARRMRENHDL